MEKHPCKRSQSSDETIDPIPHSHPHSHPHSVVLFSLSVRHSRSPDIDAIVAKMSVSVGMLFGFCVSTLNGRSGMFLRKYETADPVTGVRTGSTS